MTCKFCGNPVVVIGNCCESRGLECRFIPRKAETIQVDDERDANSRSG